MKRYFDFVNPMTYDWHGSWDGNNLHHSPLYGPEGAVSCLFLQYIFVDNLLFISDRRAQLCKCT